MRANGLKYLFLGLLTVLVGCKFVAADDKTAAKTKPKVTSKPKVITLNPDDPDEVLVIKTTQRHDGIGCTVWAGMATERAAEPDEGKCKTIVVENSTTIYTLTCLQKISEPVYKIH